jgi:nitrate/TMAO reductase-like tetraheme cytochrome c subunit
MNWLLSFIPRLWANWLTLLGSVITTVSGLALVVFALMEIASTHVNPYSGMFAIFIPMLFAVGLLIIPFGFYVERVQNKRSAERGLAVEPNAIIKAFQMAIHDRRARSLILFVGGLTVVNVVLLAAGGIRAANYMDTPQFCGTSCHTAMEPEWTAYQRSPHQNVQCVECHIGPGAGALVAAKLNGLHQLVGVITGKHSRPVPPPSHMRPTSVTCEGCHARNTLAGDRARIFPHYKPDKSNTAAFNAMMDHVGGLDVRTGKLVGIHSHLAPNKTIRYEYLDARRTRIGKITVVEDGKVKAEYALPGDEAKAPALGVRAMECTDCHNRPTHRFDGTARQAVDRAMWNGELDSKQPYLAKVAVEVLEKANVQHQDADAHFKLAVENAYAALDARPAPAEMAKAIHGIIQVYSRNVFPKMNVTWNTYPDLAGHYTESDTGQVGCFRCHDGKHQATFASGQVKKMDKSCDLCHATLATGVAPDKLEDPVKQMVGIPLD